MEELKPRHIGIIMDGNRRWAKAKNLPIVMGHKKGAEVLEKTIKYMNDIGIEYLTVYAFSTENWKRSEDEVNNLMKLMGLYLDKFLKTVKEDNVRFRVLGDLEGVPKSIKEKMIKMQEESKTNTGINFNMAFNYGGRAEIVRATKNIASLVKENKLEIEDITEELFSDNLYTHGQVDPDLVIRTSGEYRTSNFLPWQITYSEFLFFEKNWPDFTSKDIDFAIEEFSKRHRRKGK